jgi:hypothetical protein
VGHPAAVCKPRTAGHRYTLAAIPRGMSTAVDSGLEVQHQAWPRMTVETLQPSLTNSVGHGTHTCDRAMSFVLRTTDAYIAITSRARGALTKAQNSLACAFTSGYPPPLFPFLASFSALGLTCSVQGQTTRAFPDSAIGEDACRHCEATRFRASRACLPPFACYHSTHRVSE